MLASSAAQAQATPLPDSFELGGFTFRPSLEVRVRGEMRKPPVDTGGDVFDSSAVLADGFRENVPTIVDSQSAVRNQWMVAERARLGLAVDRGAFTASLTLQDARVLGTTETAFVGPGQPALPSFAPFEAYVDVHTRSRSVWFRAGRQAVTWGSGRLLSENDWSHTARSLDAGRLGFRIGNLDLQILAAVLAAPGGLPPAASGARRSVAEGTGAQLYGVDGVWHFHPLFHAELTALARVVREPIPIWLTPGDTYVLDARVFGDHRGFRYDVEAAYELGRLATYGGDRKLGAYALAGRAELETALPGHLTFGVQGAYASGGSANGDVFADQTRFDPILPDERNLFGAMGLYTWSNVIEAGGDLRAHPTEAFATTLGYRFVGLASPGDRWTTASLAPVGAARDNDARTLGHETHVVLSLTPWDPVRFEAGYGAFLMGDAARRIAREHERARADLQHWAYLQARIRAPK